MKVARVKRQAYKNALEGSIYNMLARDMKWGEFADEVEDQIDTEELQNTGNTVVLQTLDKVVWSQACSLYPNKIYWDNANELFVHVSGICYDRDP